jgi:hypothetical protein
MSRPADANRTTPVPRDEEGRPFETPSAGEPPGPSGDEREVTGEPVETDAGWVTPRQQNVGKGKTATTANSHPPPKSGPS